MISKKVTQEKVKNSVYWDKDTKLMLEKKSQETHISQNKLTELCRKGISLRCDCGVKGIPIPSRLREPDIFPES